MKVQKTVIGNKTVILDPTFGGFEKLNRRWGIKDGDILAADFLNEFCIDAIWSAMKRRMLFKPFIFKKRMKRMMKPWDMERVKLMVDFVYSGTIFTEEELQNKLKEQREQINEEIRKIRDEMKILSESEIEQMTCLQEQKTAGAVKKNGSESITTG